MNGPTLPEIKPIGFPEWPFRVSCYRAKSGAFLGDSYHKTHDDWHEFVRDFSGQTDEEIVQELWRRASLETKT